MEDLNRRCATCKHWGGDKEKAVKQFDENPISMDRLKGWPEDGDCGIDCEWLSVEIIGDACAIKTVYANFGCVYWDE
jgi:hypothetical protein